RGELVALSPHECGRYWIQRRIECQEDGGRLSSSREPSPSPDVGSERVERRGVVAGGHGRVEACGREPVRLRKRRAVDRVLDRTPHVDVREQWTTRVQEQEAG